MTLPEIILGCLLSVVGYFLKNTMDKLEEAEKQCNKNALDISVLKTDHDNKHQHMLEKFDILNTNLKELSVYIKELNNKLTDLNR